jgi:hypothetical protein
VTAKPERGVPERGVPVVPPVRLLLVEDSENGAMLLLRELGRGGYEPSHERVYTPEDMERALEEAEVRGEPYEVVSPTTTCQGSRRRTRSRSCGGSGTTRLL